MSTWPPVYHAYGIRMTPVCDDDLEMIREWRNDPEISRHMLDQTYISATMQRTWFDKICKDECQAYWLLWFKNEPIGVASLTNIDRDNGTVEPGMYIYPEQFRNNIVPFCAAFSMNDFAFEELGCTRLEGKIFADNQASLRFHETCGYQKYAEVDNNLNLYSLVPENYYPARDKIARFIRY